MVLTINDLYNIIPFIVKKLKIDINIIIDFYLWVLGKTTSNSDFSNETEIPSVILYCYNKYHTRVQNIW